MKYAKRSARWLARKSSRMLGIISHATGGVPTGALTESGPVDLCTLKANIHEIGHLVTMFGDYKKVDSLCLKSHKIDVSTLCQLRLDTKKRNSWDKNETDTIAFTAWTLEYLGHPVATETLTKFAYNGGSVRFCKSADELLKKTRNAARRPEIKKLANDVAQRLLTGNFDLRYTHPREEWSL